MRVAWRHVWEPSRFPGQLIPENLVSSLVHIHTLAPQKLIIVESVLPVWVRGRELILLRSLITVDNDCCHPDSVLGSIEALCISCHILFAEQLLGISANFVCILEQRTWSTGSQGHKASPKVISQLVVEHGSLSSEPTCKHHGSVRWEKGDCIRGQRWRLKSGPSILPLGQLEWVYQFLWTSMSFSTK